MHRRRQATCQIALGSARPSATAKRQPVGSDVLFPHLYGALNLDAVLEVHDLIEVETGFALPRGLL